MADPYQRAQLLLDKAGAPAGDLAVRITAVLENQSESYYAEHRALVAVVNDCLDRLAVSLQFDREYVDDPALELSETIAGIENVLPNQHTTIQRHRQQLAKILALAAGEDLPPPPANKLVVTADVAEQLIAAATDDEAPVLVGKASTREATDRPDSEAPLRILGLEDMQEPVNGWSQQ